jgi:DNA-binding XRE family transcriptional regulator
MKNEQRLHAKDLFLNTNLTKTQIAERVGVTRRTITSWSLEHSWDRLRRSAQLLPSMVTEKYYLLLDHRANQLLAEGSAGPAFTEKDANACSKMASVISKIKARSTVNESMEVFNYFLDELRHKDQQMAESITPFIEEHFTHRASRTIADFQLPGFNEHGYRTLEDEQQEIIESWEDEKELDLMHTEMRQSEINAAQAHEQQTTQPQPIPDTEPEEQTPPIPQPTQPNSTTTPNKHDQEPHSTPPDNPQPTDTQPTQHPTGIDNNTI